jgi:hypothetical protein
VIVFAGLPVWDKRVKDRYVAAVRQVQPESEHGRSLALPAGGIRGHVAVALLEHGADGPTTGCSSPEFVAQAVKLERR